MPRADAPALALVRPVLFGLTALNLVYAGALALLLAGTFAIPDLLLRALAGLEGGEAWQVHGALRAIVVLGLAGAFVAHRVLRLLTAIADTVRAGDPFVAANARRLQAIAWWVLGGEGVRLGVAAVARAAKAYLPTMDIDVPAFSFAPWLAVLLLFVLARVFAEGTRLRDDVAGTV